MSGDATSPREAFKSALDNFAEVDRQYFLGRASPQQLEAAYDAVLQAFPSETAPCVCGEPATLNTVHRTDGPCYAAPSATRLSDLPEANELASALKDAARYRWWRSKWVGADGEFDVLNDYLAACDTPGACDAAIDAGIKEKP